jgi:plastocyanin
MFQTKKCYLIFPLVVFFLVCTLSPILKSSTFAEEKASEEVIKTVLLKKEPAGIAPRTLKVKLGTTIVWLNNDPGPITIKFIEKLGIACKAPVNFYSNLWGYYETGKIAEGRIASICFIYKGEYTYEVKRLNEEGKVREEISTGKIIAVE